MIIKTRDGGDVKIQAAGEWGNEHWLPVPWGSRLASAGVAVTDTTAYGLPAVSNVLRSPSELIAAMPFMSYRDGSRDQARDSWQWELLHDKPGDEIDVFQFWHDVELSLEATQNAFIRKVRVRRTGALAEMYVLDAQRVVVRRDEDGSKLFDVYVSPTDVRKDLTTEDILHVRGFSTPGSVCGISLLDVHRDPIGSAIAMQRYEGDYFRNGAVPPFWFTGAANRTQAQDILDFHNANHRGPGNQGKTGSLWGSVDVKSLPVSMKDAMFIEAKNLSIEDACRIWRWPRRLLEIGELQETSVDPNLADSTLLKIYVLPRLKRIESAFAADPDVYFQRGVYGEFMTAALERGDVHTRYDAYRLARQGGWVTANELRERENLPPHPDGDQIQITPVGGAPNASTAERAFESMAELNGEATVADYQEIIAAAKGDR